CQQDYTTPWTC
nr:immunoglobulin light chain junction region [Macaca mulatta]MPN88007.1 immunoglobulin light chain junction region [Macaca mulatta]MPN88981.1 immunoglobulin light chain junction region [Macaca mulatta]